MCRLFLFALVTLFPAVAAADPAFLPVGEAVPGPHGYVELCERSNYEPDVCNPHTTGNIRIPATSAHFARMNRINQGVNADIRQVTDEDLYGLPEYWVQAHDAGDCEDVALLKRDLFVRAGWPRSALLLTVVRDRDGSGHAVLLVRTTVGDYVLDNKRDEILRWDATDYRFVMRQTYHDPRVWVSAGHSVIAATTATER